LSSAAVLVGSGLTDADKASLKQLAAAVGEFNVFSRVVVCLW
jgi:uncharacterized NAD(P)/FAD-binding protein YdhS